LHRVSPIPDIAATQKFVIGIDDVLLVLILLTRSRAEHGVKPNAGQCLDKVANRLALVVAAETETRIDDLANRRLELIVVSRRHHVHLLVLEVFRRSGSKIVIITGIPRVIHLGLVAVHFLLRQLDQDRLGFLQVTLNILLRIQALDKT